MRRFVGYLTVTSWLLFAVVALSAQGTDEPTSNPSANTPPTLADFWEGRAVWEVDIADVGLPIGESDTIAIDDTQYWSYVHASYQSAGIVDQCGQPVAFPGCLTRWESTDAGQSFSLPAQVCTISCQQCPCDDARDHHGVTPEGNRAAAQQYPRVARADDGIFYMAYEWRAQTMLRTSTDGVNWSDWTRLTNPAGTWHTDDFPCTETERIGPHPFIRGEIHNCLVGAPPGIYLEGDMIYVFVAAGSAPGHMRCYKGDRHALDDLTLCDNDPLFAGAETYGPVDVMGSDAHPYFDFRYVSSADLLRVGDHYYMAYEGIRGPQELEIGRDTQFALGFARSTGPQIDGPWEKYADNPVVEDMGFNWGIGHADLLVIDGVTFMYTTTSTDVVYAENGRDIISAGGTRGRYRLVWAE